MVTNVVHDGRVVSKETIILLLEIALLVVRIRFVCVDNVRVNEKERERERERKRIMTSKAYTK